jgi:hypothetical protein
MGNGGADAIDPATRPVRETEHTHIHTLAV